LERTQPASGSAPHLLTTAVEHSATLNYAKFLQTQGCDVTFLPVAQDGSLDLRLLEKSIRPDTALVSVIWANNETGMLFPIHEIADICRAKNVPLHTDAVQAAGKLNINVKDLGVDFLSLSAHKLHAPKGIGCLYVNRRAKYQPYIIGGHQEHGRRAGTENVASIVGFGRAAELALERRQDVAHRVRQLRDRMEDSIFRKIKAVLLNGAPQPRLPNTSNLAIAGVESEALLLKLDQAGICASSGSACTTGSLEPSHVLTAMGCGGPRARSSIRLSLGFYNTAEDVDYLQQHLPPIVSQLRAASPG
jgi:cysteine desulfurase